MDTGYRFPKSLRVLKTDEISSVFDFRRRLHGELFVVHARPNALPHARLAIVVAKKTARRAVARNYMKRVIRETFRHQVAQMVACDVVVQARRAFDRQSALPARHELARLFGSVRP